MWEVLGKVTATYIVLMLIRWLLPLLRFYLQSPPPKVVVPLKKEEMEDILVPSWDKFDVRRLSGEQDTVFLWDPATNDYFGKTPAMTPADVTKIVVKARVAQTTWRSSSFGIRNRLMRTLQRYISENQETCARVAVRESGKTMLDALVGEALTMCLDPDCVRYIDPACSIGP